MSTNSRTWFECAEPRDLRTNSSRLYSPFVSTLRSSSQVSTSEDTTSPVASTPPAPISVVSTAVIPRDFSTAISRITAIVTWADTPTCSSPVTASSTTTRGTCSSMRAARLARCDSSP